MTRHDWFAPVALVGLLTMTAGMAAGRSAPPAATKPPAAPIVRLAPAAGKQPTSSLVWSLQIDPLTRVPGNAAPTWLRAVFLARGQRFTWTGAHADWLDPEKTPLTKLPLEEIKKVLGQHAALFRLMEDAARRTRCDWGRMPLTMQSLVTEPLEEIQGMRDLARHLTLRCRFALARGDYREAQRTLQIGFALTQAVGTGDVLIQDLVALSIGSMMLAHIEEWVQIPGSPCLYWPLTELPRPLVTVRHAIHTELNTIYRSFPELRELKTKRLTAEQTRLLVEKVLEAFAPLAGESQTPDWLKKLGVVGLTLRYHATAKKGLIAHGRSPKEVEAMPALQVVAIHYLESHDRARDDLIRWMHVPAWQGLGPMMKLEQAHRKQASEDGNFLIAMLFPALVRVYQAQLRVDRHIAGLRGAEALRLHLATHGGKSPEKWSAISVPDPLDPITGKGLGAWYRLEGGTAILEIPPGPGQQPTTGRRYEWSGKR